MTKIINIKYAPFDWKTNPQYVYVGRAGKGQDGYFGNPFRLGDDEARGDTLERFREWTITRLEIDAEYRRRVAELEEKTLICFCAPEEGLEPAEHGGICHAQVLAYFAETL